MEDTLQGTEHGRLGDGDAEERRLLHRRRGRCIRFDFSSTLANICRTELLKARANSSFSFSFIWKIYCLFSAGEDVVIETIDVYAQHTYLMSLGRFRSLWKSSERKRLYNILSLEFSETPYGFVLVYRFFSRLHSCF